MTLGRSEHDKQQRKMLGDGGVRRKRSEHIFLSFDYAHTVTAALMDNLLLIEYEVWIKCNKVRLLFAFSEWYSCLSFWYISCRNWGGKAMILTNLKY